MTPQPGIQFYQNLVQPSNVTSRTQPVKAQPKTQPQKKGEKGKGKSMNKSKDDSKKVGSESESER